LECGQDFASLFRLIRIGCWMFWWTDATISCSNISMAVTCEHADSASSPTRLQLMGGGGEPREPGKYNLDIPRPTVLEDPGARAASPGATLLGMPTPVPRTTKSCNELMALSPSRGRHLPPQHHHHPTVRHQHPTPPLLKGPTRRDSYHYNTTF
jgi:hypothetical protein